jgi:hypothetical protein
MGRVNLHPVTEEAFSIVPDFSAGVLTITIAGTGDMLAVPRLRDLTLELHGEMQRLKLTSVTAHIRELYFLNSSCIKQLALWIKSIRDLAPGAQYHVKFITNGNLGWQRRALGALQAMAPDLVEISD